jgi:flagellin-specific chaperone FliS
MQNDFLFAQTAQTKMVFLPSAFYSVFYMKFLSRITLTTALVLTVAHPPLQAQTVPTEPPLVPASSGQTNTTPTNPTDLVPTTQPTGQFLLSQTGGQQLMADADRAIADQNYPLALQKLQEARQIFNQLSTFHSQLASSFAGVDTRLSDDNRNKALETAQMRDQATYQLALIHRAQNQPELAVPLFVQIISSQQPTRDLGKKSYEQLTELGFTVTNRDGSLQMGTGLLSVQGAQALIEQAEQAIASQDYVLAQERLQEARQLFNQLSNFYGQLSGSFSGIDNRLATSNRNQALATAQKRDETTYQLAMVHKSQNQPELAVPLLIQIISSQQPTRELGQKAYSQLVEMGFTNMAYPSEEEPAPEPVTEPVPEPVIEPVPESEKPPEAEETNK